MRGLVFDLANRTMDPDGRMRVAVNNISKANVCPYRGSEIPDWQALGLDPDRIYKLYRHPEELAKAAPSFNGIQLMMRHVPVSADDPVKDLVVGTTGESAVFDPPYLKNSITIWDAEAIAAIESGKQRQLSCCYRFTADMTPGGLNPGLTWDGIMREIVGNHVALVDVGRAGADVLVGDHRMETRAMSLKVQAGAVRKLFKAVKFASDSDASELVEKVEELLDQVEEIPDEGDDDAKKAEDAKKAADKKAKDAKRAADAKRAKDDKSEEDDEDEAKKKKEAEDKAAKDAECEVKKAEDAKKAMDAAISSAESNVIKRMNDRDAAKEAVRPLVGVVMGMDSAAEVYAYALKQNGVDVKGVDPSAYEAMFKMLPKRDARPAARVAMDAADDFNAAYPGAARLAAA